MPVLTIDITNRQTSLPLDQPRLRQAIARILADAGISEAAISVAVVGDAEIHDLNRRFLEHDEPTDVISFQLSDDGEPLEGDIAVSAETATAMAEKYGWSPADELLLYVIHGCLHLVGYDDLAPEPRRLMRDREAHYLAQFGLTHRTDSAAPATVNLAAGAVKS